MGFEPTPPERLEPKSSALVRSAMLPHFLSVASPLFPLTILNVKRSLGPIFKGNAACLSSAVVEFQDSEEKGLTFSIASSTNPSSHLDRLRGCAFFKNS